MNSKIAEQLPQPMKHQHFNFFGSSIFWELWTRVVGKGRFKGMWRIQLCPAIGALQRRYCFKRHSCPMEVLRCFLGWSWKLCSNSLVPFVVLGDSVDCRGLVAFWPRWFGVVNNGFGTYRCKICSSVLGRLPCLVSFWFFQKLFTVELSPSLHILTAKDFLLQSHTPSPTTSSPSIGGWLILHLSIASFHILALKLHWKNRWSRLSVPLRQNTQPTSPVYHHFANWSPIVKQSFITNHMTKACLGMALGNQISCRQSSIGFILLIVSQVSELKYFLIFSYYPDWLFSTRSYVYPRKFALNLHQIVRYCRLP